MLNKKTSAWAGLFVAFVITHNTHAEPNISQKWLNKIAKSYSQINNNDIKQLDPLFTGSAFILPNYNDKTFSINTYTTVKTRTTPWTLTNVSRYRNTLNLGKFTIFDITSMSTDTLNTRAWIAQRASYLEGQGHPRPLLQASIDLGNCATAQNCKKLKLDLNNKKISKEANVRLSTRRNRNVRRSSKTRISTSSTPNQKVTKTVITDKRVVTKTKTTLDAKLKFKASSKTTTTSADLDEGVNVKTTRKAKLTAKLTKTQEKEKRTYKRKRIEIVTEDYVREQDDAYWENNYSPILFFDKSQPLEITSMDNVYGWVRGANTPQQLSGGHYPQLQYANPNRSYRVVHNGQFSAGAGAALTRNKVNSSIRHMTFNFGAAVIAGFNYKSSQVVRGNPTKVQPLKIPKSPYALKSWSQGDSLVFGRQGGLLLTAGIGYMGLSAGINYVANGIFETSVAKVDRNTVIVSHKMIKLHNLGKSFGAGISSISLSHFASLDTSLSFAVDLSDKKTHRAYKKYIQGDLRDLQKMGFNTSNTSVVAIMTSKSKSRGTNFGISLGIPFVSQSFNRGKLYRTTHTDVLADGTKVSSQSGIFMKNLNTRFFDYSRDLNYGVSYTQTRYKNGTQSKSNQNANIVWSYSNTDTSAWRLQDAINELVRVTGMKQQFFVKVPTQQRQLGYTEVKMNMKVYPKAIKMLRQLGQKTRRLKALDKIGMGYLKAYFKHAAQKFNPAEYEIDNLLGLCKNSLANLDDNSFGDEALDRCKSMTSQQTYHALGKMQKALYRLGKAKNAKQNIKAFVSFGEAMITNAFTFQTGFSLLKGRGIDVTYTIKGEKLKNYDLTTSWGARIQ